MLHYCNWDRNKCNNGNGRGKKTPITAKYRLFRVTVVYDIIEGQHMEESVSVHPRVNERHPEIEPADVLAAWAGRLKQAKRAGKFAEETAAVGFDGKGRLLEMVAIERADGTFLVYHAMTPPSKKTLREIGL